MSETSRARLTPITPGGRRVLADLAARDGEVLIHKPREGTWQCDRDGATASWKTFIALDRDGLITIRNGFAMAMRVQITDAGRARIAGRAASTPPGDGGQQ